MKRIISFIATFAASLAIGPIAHAHGLHAATTSETHILVHVIQFIGVIGLVAGLAYVVRSRRHRR